MQGKSVVRFFLIALTAVSLIQYCMMIPTARVESRAAAYADEMAAKNPQSSWNSHKSHYLDSVSTDTLLRIPLLKSFNYAELKRNQLALGLDLKGGMSVLLQVDLMDFVKNLAAGTTDPNFTEALNYAGELQKTQQVDFITLFAQAWKEKGGGRPLASIFARNEVLKQNIKFDSPDETVIAELRKIADGTVNETYNRLKQRIDKLGVVQPNVSLDAARDLILVELPGIDNPARARALLQKAAKLEFWDTYRLADENLSQRFQNADNRLRALEGGSNAVEKDTIYEYPMVDGKPDSTQEKVMRLVDKPNQSAGPLLSRLALNYQGGAQSAVIGYADKKEMEQIRKYLSMPEVAQEFPANIRFLWSQKPVPAKDGLSGLTGKYELYAIKKYRNQDNARLDGSVVTFAGAQPDPRGGSSVSLRMNDDGAKEWEKMTTEAYNGGGREIAIVLDDEVVSAPGVRNGPISGGSSEITGNFTLEEATDLANILEVGKLPAGTRIVQESQIGPSLGKENIQRSLITLILSVILLCIFMIAYYAKGGVVSVIALLANIFFILGTLASMGTVLTLPGIAGIVLTLATAVDANVIIYERIREELRDGMAHLKAIAEGFKRALPAIIDANVTTMLTAIVLMYYGLGPIKGFGTVLLVGIFCSMFTAVLVGRMITDWWSERTEMTYSLPWSERWLVGANYDWIGKRKMAYIFSGTLILIGIVSFVMRGFELGVDFKGGYSFNVQFDKPVSADQLRDNLTKVFEGNPVVKAVSTTNTYNITTSYLINERGEDVMDRVVAKLHEGVQATGVSVPIEAFRNPESGGTRITSSSQVGPTVADDIRKSSFYAGIAALLTIFIYLLLRFRRWQFSLGAILALAHDVLITLTFFTLLHGLVPFSLEIDQAIIACLLTVIGLSVNDTVVVYDRIREFINKFPGQHKSVVLNAAINTTLTRTIITSGTILIVVLLLFLMGGGAIKGFAFGILIGILFGTYSSIFVASSIVHDLTKEDILVEGKSKPLQTAESQATSKSAGKKALTK